MIASKGRMITGSSSFAVANEHPPAVAELEGQPPASIVSVVRARGWVGPQRYLATAPRSADAPAL